MSFLRLLVTVAVAIVPLHAAAADLPSRYTVDEKALKSALAGTNLTFQLYSDALCTASVYSTVIAIENVDLLSRIKPFNPKNAAKKKNTVEMRATLTGVPALPSLHMKVTGTGVTPIGGACQSQPSGLGGGASPLVVKDSTATTIGNFDTSNNGVILNDGGTLVRIGFLTTAGFTQFYTTFSVVFVSNDCTGTALNGVDTSLVHDGFVLGTTAYYFPTSGATATLNSALYRNGPAPNVSQAVCDANYGVGNTTFVAPDGCCQLYGPVSYSVGPVPTIDVSGFVPPFSVQ